MAEWSTMESTKKGEWRDKFNISVRKIGASKTFQTIPSPGGEKRKVRIACSLALQDLGGQPREQEHRAVYRR